jgi:hypothetical protein
MIAIPDGIVEDGFSIFLLIAALAFLWFRKPGKRYLASASSHPKARALNKIQKHTRKAA